MRNHGMHLDERDLELFRAVADAGSITHGAAAVGLALAAASARLRTLEQRLGVVLLERRRHGVVPTPAGRLLLQYAGALLAQADELRAALSLLRGGLAGSVRLLTNTNGYLSFLPDRLAGFLRDHPQIDVQVAERTSETIVEAIRRGQAELGITAGEADAAGLETLPFAIDRYVIVAPPDHPLAGKTQVTFAETLAFPFVAGPSHGLFVGHARRCAQPLRARTQMRDHAQVCRLVSTGIGIGIVPRSIAETLICHLVIISLADGWAERRLALCALSFDRLARPARMLTDYLVPNDPTNCA